MTTDVLVTAGDIASIKDGDTLTFTYAMKDGHQGPVAGTAAGLIRQGGEIAGIRVHVSGLGTDAVITASASAVNGPVGFAPGRMTSLTVTRKPAPRPGYATERQVSYALSLCNRDGAGAGNFYRPTAAEFRAMRRAEISEWIDTAKFELGED